MVLCKTYLKTNKDTNHRFPNIKHPPSDNNNLFNTSGYKEHSVSTKCHYYNSELTNIDWTISNHCEPIFLKELCIYKRKKLNGDVEMGRNISTLIKSKQVSSLIQPTMTKKCRDPDIFTIPCTIGKCTFAYAMLDLGASINVMPSIVYRSLKFGDLEPTSVMIQLANISIVHPLGIIKDVMV
ncbi:hypothetical protein CR513_06223, partial [Mucuna pruriens]